MDTLQVQRRKNEKGFTLVELLVVIVIIGILAAVAVFAVGGITDRGNVSACNASANSLRTASEAFRAEASDGIAAASLADLEPEFIQLDDTTWDGSANSFTVGGDTITYHGSAAVAPNVRGDVTDNCA